MWKRRVNHIKWVIGGHFIGNGCDRDRQVKQLTGICIWKILHENIRRKRSKVWISNFWIFYRNKCVGPRVIYQFKEKNQTPVVLFTPTILIWAGSEQFFFFFIVFFELKSTFNRRILKQLMTLNKLWKQISRTLSLLPIRNIF